MQTFSTLRSDTSRSRWTAATKFRAPHKPLLLPAVIGLIAQGIMLTIELLRQSKREMAEDYRTRRAAGTR